MVDWGQELETQYAIWQDEHGGHNAIAAVGSKRTADGSVGGPSMKKPKKEDDGDLPTEEDMRISYEKGKLDKLTVAVLKGYCQFKKLPTSGKKADLIQRVIDYFESK